MQALLSLGEWLESTSFGTFVRTTIWGYPYVQLIHFAGLSLWVGTIAAVDLRLMGLAGRRHSVAELAEQLLPWTWTGLGIAVLGGILLFSGIATSYVQNAAFQVKFPLVLLGIAYHVVIQRKVGKWGRSLVTPPVAKLAGFTEFVLWFAIVTAAVYIPNY